MYGYVVQFDGLRSASYGYFVGPCARERALSFVRDMKRLGYAGLLMSWEKFKDAVAAEFDHSREQGYMVEGGPHTIIIQN